MRFFAIFLFIAVLVSAGCEKIPIIEITSTPSGATVFIDGVEVGTTPYKKEVTPETTHQVLVTKPGYQAATTELQYQGKRLSRSFQLQEISLSNMILIPAGKFTMGTSDEQEELVKRQLGGGELAEYPRWFASEKPQQEIHVESFYIDKFEVTNADYQKFIDATGYDAPRHWENRKYREGEDNLPIVYVNWRDAPLTLNGQVNGCQQRLNGKKPPEAPTPESGPGVTSSI